MNHPSAWTRIYRDGRHVYRHKGTGVIRDSLMSIGRFFGRKAKDTAQKVAAKAAEKLAAKAVEKGSKKIQAVLRKKRPPLSVAAPPPVVAPPLVVPRPLPVAVPPPVVPYQRREPDWEAINRLLSDD